MTGGVLEDVNRSDITVSNDREADLDLASELRRMAKRRLIAPVDLRKIPVDRVTDDEGVDFAIIACMADGRRPGDRECKCRSEHDCE